MRRLSIALFMVVTLVLLAGAAGCGTSAQTAGPASADLSPEGILAQAVAASQEMVSAKGSFEVAVSFDVDPGVELPEEAMALVGQPMKVSGTLAFESDQRAGEFTVSVSVAGQVRDVGMKLLGDKVWFRFMDQWYEAPPEMQQMLGDASGQVTKVTEIQQLLADMGLDPTTWMADLRLVGEETIDGAAVYHLAASPDLAKMMADVVGLMQSGELMKLLDPSGSGDGLMGTASSLPSAGELQEMQKQLQAMFTDLAADLWIAKDSFAVLKVTAGARMTPPSGEDADGLNAIILSAMISLQDINEPVTVEPPASVQPWTALEKAMEDTLGTFMAPLLGAASGSAVGAPDTYQ
ncbi:MAG: hypothetical protein V1912_04515 [bacterium]